MWVGWRYLESRGAKKSLPTHDPGAAGVQQVLFVQGHVEVGREMEDVGSWSKESQVE